MNTELEKIIADIQPYRQSLLSHPLYEELKNLDNFQILMEHHIFAVWDYKKPRYQRFTGTEKIMGWDTFRDFRKSRKLEVT